MAVPVAIAAGQIGKNILTSKLFWIIVVIILVLYLANRHWDKIRGNVGRIRGDFQPGGITDKRKGELEALADELYRVIYSTATETWRYTVYEKANALNDNELLYLGKYYKQSKTGGTSLYRDIDDEWMPFSSIDEQLMSRLAQLKLR